MEANKRAVQTEIEKEEEMRKPRKVYYT